MVKPGVGKRGKDCDLQTLFHNFPITGYLTLVKCLHFSVLRVARGSLGSLTGCGSVDILATLSKFERTIGRLHGFLWRQEVRWPKSDSCLLPASLCKSPGRCSLATEAVSANANLPSRSCWPFSV